MKESFDIIETAIKAGNFQVFTQALIDGGFEESLKEKGAYTVFAPTDEAFAKVPKAKIDELFRPGKRENLQLLLRNHIVLGKLTAAELMRLDKTKTAKGEEMRIDSRDGLRIQDARVLLPDLEASNGVLHGIDTVLMPQATVAIVG